LLSPGTRWLLGRSHDDPSRSCGRWPAAPQEARVHHEILKFVAGRPSATAVLGYRVPEGRRVVRPAQSAATLPQSSSAPWAARPHWRARYACTVCLDETEVRDEHSRCPWPLRPGTTGICAPSLLWYSRRVRRSVGVRWDVRSFGTDGVGGAQRFQDVPLRRTHSWFAAITNTFSNLSAT
jgi:hypothetical protein